MLGERLQALAHAGLAPVGPVLVAIALALLALWLLVECGVRVALARPLARGFYGSIPRERVRDRQRLHGVKTATGPGWVHLGWIADPERERYRVEVLGPEGFRPVGRARFGSFLVRGADREARRYRVCAVPRRGRGEARSLGEVTASAEPPGAPVCVPRIAGPWRTLFRPSRSGRYVNDHAIYRDGRGRFRLLGITSRSEGDFRAERYFASASSAHFPPPEGMREEAPVADFGELAWAPDVVRHGDRFHLFWSPHRLHHMSSADGVHWSGHRVVLDPPQHRFFRDASVLAVAEGQWLLFATGRGRYFSRVDVYQSFDLREWQYIRPGLRCGLGSGRNSPFASTESPLVTRHRGRYYLSVTYNNDSFFWHGLLLLRRRWRRPERYNDTLVFHADDPYDFGRYRGTRRTPTLLTRLEAHAPRLYRHPDTGAWYVTTAGWPWAATLTSGEVAVAPLAWEPGGEPREGEEGRPR